MRIPELPRFVEREENQQRPGDRSGFGVGQPTQTTALDRRGRFGR